MIQPKFDLNAVLNNDTESVPSWLAKLESVKVDINAELQPPQIALSLINPDGKYCTIATLGNFSLVIGKAKSRKTFFITMAMAGACVNEPMLNKFIGMLPPHQNRVVLFDTEQGTYHVQKVCKRVVKLIGYNPTNFEAYGLRTYPPDERLKLIEEYIYNTPDLGFVVIDGVRDLINSINDEAEATALTSKVLKWTGERNIHIVCLLHQNKGDNNARGHVGSELVNKAETVLSITKEGVISIVEPLYCRDIEPVPFGFTITDEGLPTVEANVAIRKEGERKPTLTAQNVPHEKHLHALRLVFDLKPKQTYSELVANIKERFGTIGVTFGDNKAKDFLTHYQNNDFVIKPDAKHYSLNPDNKKLSFENTEF